MGFAEHKRRTDQADAEQLGAEVLALTLRQVRVTYEQYNDALFGGRLSLPSLQWSESDTEWGAWVRAERTLRLSKKLVDEPWGLLTEVLKHEMAHQYVDEVEGLREGEGPHGTTFTRVCIERGIDARATGTPSSPSGVSEPRHQAILRRIEQLLALAQSDNRHEAESAMATARRLMLKYNLQEAASGRAGSYTFRHLGEPTGRRMAWQRRLANILSDYFFVDVIIVPVYRPREGKRGSVVEAIGTSHNLELAVYAHDFLQRAALSCWKRHKKLQGIRSDQDKQSYLYGVMEGFAAKLDGEAEKVQKEGLVWLGDPELGRYFRRRHPHVRTVSGRTRLRQDAFSKGHDAGGRIVLHKGVDGGSTRTNPRLLRGRK